MRGSIKKRGGQRITVIDVGRDSQPGKRRQQKRVHETRQAAVAHLAAVVGALHAGDYVPPTKVRWRVPRALA